MTVVGIEAKHPIHVFPLPDKIKAMTIFLLIKPSPFAPGKMIVIFDYRHEVLNIPLQVFFLLRNQSRLVNKAKCFFRQSRCLFLFHCRESLEGVCNTKLNNSTMEM